MDVSRGVDAHGASDAEWQAHVAEREAEIRSGTAASRELSRADGRTMICTMAPLSGGKRLVSYVDVTEMKQREAELADALEQSKLAEAVIDGVRDPVFVKDSELNFVIANRAFSGMFGLEPEAMVGKSDRDFFSPEEAARFAAAERQVLSTGEALEFEEDPEFSGAGRTRIVRKNRVRTASGKDYVSCFLFDVTEMKRREVEANEARKQLADVLERMPAGVVIYDRDDNFVFANRKLQESLPALKSIWKPGRTLRDAFDHGHSVGYFRSSGDPQVDELYDVDKQRWIDAIIARYHLRHFEFERQQPGRPLVPGLRHAHRRRHVHRGARRHHRAQAARKGAARLDAPDRPVPARARRTAGGRLHQGGRSAHRIRQQGLELDYRHFQGGGRRPHRSASCSAATRPRATPMPTPRSASPARSSREEEPVIHRDGTVRQLMTRKSRLVAIDGSVHLVGSSTDITDVKAREDAAQREPARERGVPQPDRQCAGGDLRQAPRPQAVLRQQGLVRPDRPQQGRRDRQDRRRDLRTGRRGLHGRRPRGAADQEHARRSPRPSPRRRHAALPDRSQERDDRDRRFALSDRLDDRHHRAQAARAGTRARRSARRCSPTAPSPNSSPI